MRDGVDLSIDLNLLLALDALLRERNVTHAAQRLGITQPGASSALARLRRHFDDDLLVRTGRSYELTSLGAQLLAHTGAALAGVSRVFNSTIAFDAATSTREFRLVVSDYSAMVLGDLILPRLRELAPNVRLHLDQSAHGAIISGGRDELNTVDGAILARGTWDGSPAPVVFVDDWVCVVPHGSASRLTRSDMRAAAWVLSHDRATGVTAASAFLDPESMHAVLVVEDLLSVPFLVGARSGAAFVPRRLAERMSSAAGVQIATTPVRTPRIRMEFWQHPVLDHDPGNRWLRQLIESAAQDHRVAAG